MATIELIFCLLLRWCVHFLHADAARHHHGGHLRSQIAALLQWKSALRNSSPALDSWQQGTSLCSSNWTGVVCTAMHRGRRAPLAVTEISLPNAGLDGYLGELNFSALPFLTYIDLTYNSLRGEIPLTITSLPELSHLDLSSNWLNGSIPPEFGNMPHLSGLGFFSNNLIGRIPASLGNLTTLGPSLDPKWKSTLRNSSPALDSWQQGDEPVQQQTAAMHRGRRVPLAVTKISLSNAGLDGYLGEINFSAFPFLTHIHLTYNSLRGEIPLAITSLLKLSYLDLGNNWLHGQIPSEAMFRLQKISTR
ncbi:putative leucine-rich repeat receptor-like serine/threonine-protein kinase At3g53590 [Miscanthus floridulus]|uniref:putative leucine-rich repeat receptor-like serine/threonine-protein kinase At3g53590 n=1 Tax=Miscanthus floridulus TaxID=154761 RepID=UPI00345AC434